MASRAPRIRKEAAAIIANALDTGNFNQEIPEAKPGFFGRMLRVNKRDDASLARTRLSQLQEAHKNKFLDAMIRSAATNNLTYNSPESMRAQLGSQTDVSRDASTADFLAQTAASNAAGAHSRVGETISNAMGRRAGEMGGADIDARIAAYKANASGDINRDIGNMAARPLIPKVTISGQGAKLSNDLLNTAVNNSQIGRIPLSDRVFNAQGGAAISKFDRAKFADDYGLISDTDMLPQTHDENMQNSIFAEERARAGVKALPSETARKIANNRLAELMDLGQYPFITSRLARGEDLAIKSNDAATQEAIARAGRASEAEDFRSQTFSDRALANIESAKLARERVELIRSNGSMIEPIGKGMYKDLRTGQTFADPSVKLQQQQLNNTTLLEVAKGLEAGQVMTAEQMVAMEDAGMNPQGDPRQLAYDIYKYLYQTTLGFRGDGEAGSLGDATINFRQ